MPEYLRRQSLEDRVADLEARLAEALRTNQIGNTTLTNGTLIIRRGGRIEVRSAEDPNRVVVRIGDIGMPDSTGTPQMGIQLRRDTPANELTFAQQDAFAWTHPGFGTQGLAMYDRAGNVVISADTIGGKGASFPWRPVGFSSGGYWAEPRTYSTTWQELTSAAVPCDSPRMTIIVGFVGDQVGGVNTGGDYRIVMGGTTTVASGTVPATFGYVYANLTVDLTPWYAPNNWVRASVQVQRTSGATTGGPDNNGGSIRAEVVGAYLLGT